MIGETGCLADGKAREGSMKGRALKEELTDKGRRGEGRSDKKFADGTETDRAREGNGQEGRLEEG